MLDKHEHSCSSSTSTWNGCTYILWRAKGVNEACEPCHSHPKLEYRKPATTSSTSRQKWDSNYIAIAKNKQAGKNTTTNQSQFLPCFVEVEPLETYLCFQFCRVAFHVCSSRSLNNFKNWAGQTWIILSLISKKDDIKKIKKYMFYDHRLPGKKDLFSLSAGPGLWYRLSQSIPFHALPSQQVDGIRPRGGAAWGGAPCGDWNSEVPRPNSTGKDSFIQV